MEHGAHVPLVTYSLAFTNLDHTAVAPHAHLVGMGGEHPGLPVAVAVAKRPRDRGSRPFLTPTSQSHHPLCFSAAQHIIYFFPSDGATYSFGCVIFRFLGDHRRILFSCARAATAPP